MSSRTNPSSNRAAAAFRQAAVSVKGSQSELGAFYRRKRSQKGLASAATATAHKIARLYYSLVMNGTEYQEQGARAYEERERERMVANLKKRAKSLGFELVAKTAFILGRKHSIRIQPTERFYNNTGTAVIMRGKKILALIIALALLLVCIVALRLRRDKPIGPSVSETSRLIGGPAFEIQVEMPAFNSGRAPWEIPGVILGYDHGPRFNQASSGAQVGKIAADHIELRADGGWDILIETDGEGRLTQGTYVAFPVKIGGRPLKFNCRPADLTVGYLHTTARTGSDELEGSFQLEVAICENAASGKTAAWPYQPLKVRGNFAGLKKQGER